MQQGAIEPILEGRSQAGQGLLNLAALASRESRLQSYLVWLRRRIPLLG
jgi:hypothetical protein